MAGSQMERCKSGSPCIFCGNVGYDIRVFYDDAQTVHWCHDKSIRAQVKKGDIIPGADGKNYLCISENKPISANGMGEFHLFREYLSKEDFANRKTSCSQIIKRDPGELIKGECKRLSHKEMDERLRYFLSLLILEERDREVFEREWVKSNGINCMYLLEDYPVRSLPLPDKTRFAYKVDSKNPTRKQVVNAMLDKFGDLRGMPGFFLRGGKYYEGKPERERWTFGGEGIVFPCYDADGLLYAIRLKDAFPAKELKEGRDEPFNGQFGTFVHSYDLEGLHQWKFTPKNGETVLVTSKGKTIVPIGKDWCPEIGKVTNKYKNFSSVLEKRNVFGEVYNALDQGTRSGSPYSVYAKHSRKERMKFAIITEGEKKGMVANAFTGMTTVVVPGVWSYRSLFENSDGGMSVVESLKQSGVTTIIVCYDADKWTNEDVKKAEAALITEIRNSGIVPLVGDWSNKLEKGLDDLLLQGLLFNLKPV